MRTNADLAGKKTNILGTIYFANGTSQNISNSDFIANSLSIKQGCMTGGDFTVGSAVIGSCSFGLWRPHFTGKSWKDARVFISVVIDNTTINFGEFLVDSHNESGNVVSINALDRMSLLDEHHISELGITFPATAGSVVSAICNARGLSTSGLKYPSFTLPDPKSDTMTERECISYIAQIMGQFVYVSNNVLRFGWFSNLAVNAGTTFNHDFATEDTVIGGVTVTSGSNTETRGSGNMVKVSGNPFIDETNISTVAGYIYSAVQGITYRVGSCNILSDANIEPGDRLQVSTSNDTVNILATNVTFKTSAVQESITSDGRETKDDLRPTPEDQINKMANDAISNQLDDPNSDLSKAIEEAGGGNPLGDHFDIKNHIGYRHYKERRPQASEDWWKQENVFKCNPIDSGYSYTEEDAWGYYDHYNSIWKQGGLVPLVGTSQNTNLFAGINILGNNNPGEGVLNATKDIVFNYIFGLLTLGTYLTVEIKTGDWDYVLCKFPGIVFQRPPVGVDKNETDATVKAQGLKDPDPAHWHEIPRLCMYIDCRASDDPSQLTDDIKLTDMLPDTKTGAPSAIRIVITSCDRRGYVNVDRPRYTISIPLDT